MFESALNWSFIFLVLVIWFLIILVRFKLRVVLISTDQKHSKFFAMKVKIEVRNKYLCRGTLASKF